MILYFKNPKDFYRKLLDLVGTFSNIAIYKINPPNVMYL